MPFRLLLDRLRVNKRNIADQASGSAPARCRRCHIHRLHQRSRHRPSNTPQQHRNTTQQHVLMKSQVGTVRDDTKRTRRLLDKPILRLARRCCGAGMGHRSVSLQTFIFDVHPKSCGSTLTYKPNPTPRRAHKFFFLMQGMCACNKGQTTLARRACEQVVRGAK